MGLDNEPTALVCSSPACRMFVVTVAFIVAITQAQRKIPIQHVKRIVGNKMYGGQIELPALRR